MQAVDGLVLLGDADVLLFELLAQDAIDVPTFVEMVTAEFANITALLAAAQ